MTSPQGLQALAVIFFTTIGTGLRIYLVTDQMTA
jgi:hypothetical protein